MSKYEPINREDAFAYQFEDDVKVLKQLALVNEDTFEKGLKTLEAHIAAYRNKTLKRTVTKTKNKHKAQQAYMAKNYPHLI